MVSNGYGKGRVYLRYIANDCNTYTYFDIFKSFSAAGFEISGPDCMAPGDVVVLSVQPLLTEHLSDQIGIDRYYWNVTATPKPSFVDRIVYAAGDGSAVTFVAGNVSDSDYVTVNFGVCNQATDRAARQKLGKTAPKPEVPEEVCAEYGVRSITLSVSNPVEGVEYSWWCKNAKWQFDRTIGTSVAVTLDAESAEDIIVTASYIDGSGCSGTETAIKVNRSWGTDVALTSPNSTSYQFTAGSTYEFKLTGQLSSGSIEWLCPQGWSIAPASSQGYANIKLIPGTGALLQDTLRARTHSCSESGYDMVEHLVYVRPAPVAAISGETCLTAGQQYVFRVAAEGNGPKADSYTWKINNNTVAYASFTGDSLVFIATDGMTSIAVRPNGLNGCTGSFYTQNLLFKPVTPTGIVSPSCIAYNMPDTVTFSIEEPVANQQYAWTIPNGWSLVESRNNGREIDVRTTGVEGEYIVSAQSIGTGICGNSAIISDTVHINSVSSKIDCYAALNMFTLTGYENTDDYYWYYVQNGTDVSVDVLRNNTTRFVEWRGGISIGEISATNNSTIVLEYTTAAGCRARLTYGVALNPAVDYRSQIPASAQRKSARQNMFDSEDKALVVSPNPTSAELSVSLQDNSPFELYIIDLNGKIVYTDTSVQSTYLLDVSAWKQDVYIVFALQNGKQVSYSKFIKQ